MSFAIFILYSLTQFFGIFIANEFLSSWSDREISQITMLENPLGAWIYFLAILLLAVFLFYFRKKPLMILEPMIALLLWAGLAISFQLFMSVLLSYLLAIFIVWLFFVLREVWFHNLVIIFSVAGIAGIAGLNFPSWVMILILAAVAIYDYWMIKSNRHMIHTAKEFLKENMFLGLIAPKTCQGYFYNLRKSDFEHNNFSLFAAGDLAFPLMFASSVLRNNQNLNDALIIVIFGIFGALSISFFTKKTRLIPGLIPITAFLILGYILTLIF